MTRKRQAPTNTRLIREQTERRLAMAVVLCLILLGGGLVGVVYGTGVAMVALSCVIVGSSVLGLLWLALSLMEWWVGRE